VVGSAHGRLNQLRDAADNLRQRHRREDDACAAEQDTASRKLAAAEVGLGRYCSPRHGMPFTSPNEGSQCVG